MFGCYPPNAGNVDLQAIYMPPKTQSRVWFNVWDSIPEMDIRYLAFDDFSPPVKRSYPTSLVSAAPFIRKRTNNSWIFSFCNMRGVTEIILCRDITLDHKPIIGMILRYADGSRASVGQFRFDLALQTIQIEDKVVSIGSQWTKRNLLYVASVTVDPPSDEDGLSWVDSRRGSKLEWWFSSCHSLVRYCGMQN